MSESGCSEVLDYGDQSLDPGKVQARFQERISQVSTENLEKTRESWGWWGWGYAAPWERLGQCKMISRF